MNRSNVSTTSNTRPYRSHKVPACATCRKRKILCNVDVPNQSCRFCRERGSHCTFSNKIASSEKDETRRYEEPATKQSRLSHETAVNQAGNEPAALSQGGTVPLSSPPGSASVMVNPTLAEDIDVLEHYFTSHVTRRETNSKPYSRVAHAEGESIVYLSVPRRREGIRLSKDPGRSQREIMEQVLGPFQEEVLKLYFYCFHPCFPILDEGTFWDLWLKSPERISSALLCNMYASSLPFWSRSDRLRRNSCPQLPFAWDQAVAALHEDFMAPSITTIHAALLDLSGRPVLQVMNNITTAGRIVTLAHSLGLHRNPTAWNATEEEKSLRIRLWWGVLIHDYWSSLAHGTPPNIQRAHYDVPLPLDQSLSNKRAFDRQNNASVSFAHLCSLTQILGQTLSLVYTLHPDESDMEKSIRRIECNLDDWEESLPRDLRADNRVIASTPSVNGSSSLRFCFLSLKLLICRVGFRMTFIQSRQIVEAKKYRLALLRSAACHLAEYVTLLEAEQLSEFWLPYTAHLLVSAATVLLRCTIESDTDETKKECASTLIKFIDRLQVARDVSQWDLADFCLERCKDPVEKIAAAIGINFNGPHTDTTTDALGDSETASMYIDENFMPHANDLFLPVDSLDYPWETLWESFVGPSSINV